LTPHIIPHFNPKNNLPKRQLLSKKLADLASFKGFIQGTFLPYSCTVFAECIPQKNERPFAPTMSAPHPSKLIESPVRAIHDLSRFLSGIARTMTESHRINRPPESMTANFRVNHPTHVRASPVKIDHNPRRGGS
jgi:hypothetical protein